MSQDGEDATESGTGRDEPPAIPLVPRRPLRIADSGDAQPAAQEPPLVSQAPVPSTVREPLGSRASDVPPEPAPAHFAPPVEESFTQTEMHGTTAEIIEEVVEDLEATPALDKAAEIVSRPPPSIDVAPASQLSTEEALALLEDDEETPAPELEVEPETPAPPVVKPPPPQLSMRPALPTATPKKKPWWEEVFGDDFSRGHRGLGPEAAKAEVDFIAAQLGIERGAVVLDLCCGQGELTVELNRRGFSVVGYDLSVYQLAMAGDNAQAAKQKINFLQGDMREMAFESMFDALVCWDTSFGYFEEDKNVEVARRMWNAIKPGGSLLLDVMNRDHVAQNSPHNHWFEGDGCICMDDMQLDWITSRLKVKRSIILDDGRSKELTFSIRLYTLSELGKLLHSVGFRVAAVSGHPATPGAFLGPQSPRIIIRADRPEE